MKKLLAILVSVVMLFGAVAVSGCGNDDNSRFEFCEHVSVRFVLYGETENILTHENIIDVRAGYDETNNDWYVMFYLDDFGTAAFANATRIENHGRQLRVFVTANNQKNLIYAPTIQSHIVNGEAQIFRRSGMGEQLMKRFVNQLRGHFCDLCNPSWHENLAN